MKYLIIATVALLAGSGCTNLDEEIYSNIPFNEYGKNPAEVQTISGSAYASLRGFNDGSSICYPACEYVFFLHECASDEVCVPTRGADWYDNGRYQQAEEHKFTADNAMVLSGWKYCYSGIAKCNFGIFAIENAGLDEETERKAKAELRGIRAYYYFLLLDWFGNVPISKAYDEETPGTSSRAEVFAFVESELKDIVNDLQPEILYGFFTQNVCNTLLARLYINAEVFTGTARWQDCIDACNLVKGYTLTANTLDNFITENQFSTEIIFAIPYDHLEGTLGNYLPCVSYHYNQWQKYGASSGAWSWSVNGISAQPGVYSSFDESDPRRAALCEGIQYKFTDGTPIISQGGMPLDYTENIIDYYNALQNEGCRLAKYEVKAGEKPERDHDLVVMRYAEVLMMKAECFVRLGQPDKAKPFVNQIRSRSKQSSITETITLEILDKEWLREFVFEGIRRTVNVRMGTYFEPNWVNPNPTPKEYGIFPIPETELVKNPKLVQNPGY